PGISFFDRPDQFDAFKLHLPYICRTSENVDTLFLAPINRRAPFEVLCGLVETDWYANPVNLILRRPAAGCAVHIRKEDAVAQLVFVERSHRRANVMVVPSHARLARDLKGTMAEWHARHDADRAAYKRLARSHQGRIDVARDDDLARCSRRLRCRNPEGCLRGTWPPGLRGLSRRAPACRRAFLRRRARHRTHAIRTTSARRESSSRPRHETSSRRSLPAQ